MQNSQNLLKQISGLSLTGRLADHAASAKGNEWRWFIRITNSILALGVHQALVGAGMNVELICPGKTGRAEAGDS
jgi:hypothetical protein